MCDFKPGDEVVCVDDRRSFNPLRLPVNPPPKGSVWTVSKVGFRKDTGELSIWLVGFANPTPCGDVGFFPRRFRKVQRRDLSAWLQTAATDTDHLDKPIKTPARPKVDALLKRVQSGAFG